MSEGPQILSERFKNVGPREMWAEGKLLRSCSWVSRKVQSLELKMLTSPINGTVVSAQLGCFSYWAKVIGNVVLRVCVPSMYGTWCRKGKEKEAAYTLWVNFAVNVGTCRIPLLRNIQIPYSQASGHKEKERLRKMPESGTGAEMKEETG